MSLIYTSDKLSEISIAISESARDAGLLVLPGVEIVRSPDVELDGEEVDILAALHVAALVNAPFICVDAATFEADELREIPEYSDLPVEAERIVESAETRNGLLMSVAVSWVSDGLSYRWMAQADWIGPLLSNIEAAVQDSELEADAEYENSRIEYRETFQAAVAALVESRRFRGEQLSRRKLVAPSVLSEAGVRDAPEGFLNRQVLPEANRIVAMKAYEYEQAFRTRVLQMGSELRGHPDWQRVFTKARRTDIALKFLMEKAEGYRLPKLLAEEVSEAAAKPVNTAHVQARPE
ncbi:hypothetical protein [Arthrobacter sp. zg-Y844]|uniref:hypothetical protein n=1 Tax=Arthrobacter sp. zg-Y844 TaxID=2964612 RepID=UPI0021031C94|nr:hypothetical protein [Arthrobacter sp. zg-Y844]MCQ1988233.1 hypothetical protein [Arthrobacter sp. zg-Y844]